MSVLLCIWVLGGHKWKVPGIIFIFQRDTAIEEAFTHYGHTFNAGTMENFFLWSPVTSKKIMEVRSDIYSIKGEALALQVYTHPSLSLSLQ